MYDFYQNLGFKLAPYVSVNPVADVGNFYGSLITQSQFGILGLPYGDPTISYILSEFEYEPPKQLDRLQIPFSPMLASALSVSVFFWLYITFIYISRFAARIQSFAQNIAQIIDVQKAPFTLVGVTIALSLTLLWSFFAVLGFAWRILF